MWEPFDYTGVVTFGRGSFGYADAVSYCDMLAVDGDRFAVVEDLDTGGFHVMAYLKAERYVILHYSAIKYSAGGIS